MYICECGREFDKPNAFNGHKSKCLIHLRLRYGDDFELNLLEMNKKISETLSRKHQDTKNIELTEWLNEKHRCLCCGKIMTKRFGSGRFCSRSCANTRVFSAESREKKSKTLKGNLSHKENTKRKQNELKYYESPNTCVICSKVLPYDMRARQTCSVECYRLVNSMCGRKSAQSQSKRSKNEIHFYNLCVDKFNKVSNNLTMFDGWDSDIIIEDFKLAILWNGPWHYIKLKSNQSLKQIQNRDRIKIDKIISCGYTPIIIKDMGKENVRFVNAKFQQLLDLLKDINTLTRNQLITI